MSILNKTKEEDIVKYNEFVRQKECASPYQDLNWGIVKDNSNIEAVYLEKNEKITAAMTVLVKTSISGFTTIYAPRGPVSDIYDMSVTKEMMKDIDALAKKYNAFSFIMDPEVVYDETLAALYKSKGFKIKGKKATRDQIIQPRYNMILDIEGKSEEDIFSGFSEKTRYNIRLAKKKGVTVRYSREQEDLDKLYDLLTITGKRDKIFVRPKEYFERILRAYPEDRSRIYISEFEGNTVSAALALNYGGKLYYLYGASSNENRNVMPNYIMQQEMIKWAIESGCCKYDFGGVFELNKNNGLYKFKEGFCRTCGVTEYIGEITKVYNKPKYFIFNTLKPMYVKVIKFFSKRRNK